jgi:hypothetical protein
MFKTKLIKTTLAFSLALLTSSSFVGSAVAHEGHDHGPAQVQAPKGGIIRSLETVHLELLNRGKTISVYIYDLNLKPEDVKKFPVSATVALPKKKAQPLPLVEKGDHWEAEFDAKGAHRYNFELSIKQGGHNDKLNFTVEPKK